MTEELVWELFVQGGPVGAHGLQMSVLTLDELLPLPMDRNRDCCVQ